MIKNPEHKIKLRHQFESEHGIEWITEQGEPDLDYVHWLEEKVPQNLPKADAYSLLAEVRSIIDSLYGKRADDMYSQALDDIKEKLSEHFS